VRHENDGRLKVSPSKRVESSITRWNSIEGESSMRSTKRMLALAAMSIAAMSIAAMVAAPTLYAHDAQQPSGSMMRGGMMGGGGGMMGGGDMTGRMSRMMDHCGAMMQGGSGGARPNDQWRKGAPATPDKDD
jgi:hypothetical protein